MAWLKATRDAILEGLRDKPGPFRKAVREAKATEAHRVAFVQWVLREAVPSSPAVLAVADLWGTDASPQAWSDARQAVLAERDAAREGDPSYVVWQIDTNIAKTRRPDLTPGKTSPLVSRDADPAAVSVLRMAFAAAQKASVSEMAAECAFSATFPDRPECMRGIVQCAALQWDKGLVRDEAYRVMAAALLRVMA